MADFTGMTVQVTLKPPSNLQLIGRVKQVVAGQVLTLQDVYFPHNGARSEIYRIQGPSIADLQVVDTSALPPAPSSSPSVLAQPPIALPIRSGSGQQQRRQTSDFVDPAILSYGRSPGVAAAVVEQPPKAVAPVKGLSAEAKEGLEARTSPVLTDVVQSNKGGRADYGNVSNIAQSGATQTREAGLGDQGTPADSSIRKKQKRQKKKPEQSSHEVAPPTIMNIEVTRNGNDMNGSSVKKAKGWRSTPLLQPSPRTPDTAHKSGQRTLRKKKGAREAEQNGWATEDASEIQDLGDFDFEANHKLFDKKEVFDQLRQGDTTADEERLVSHNKLPRPGTSGGKNLHPTENVLSPRIAPYHSNELESTSDADTELDFPNGRSSSKHSLSRVTMKKQPSRQNSSQIERPHPLSASMSSVRSGTSFSGKRVPPISTSPMPTRTRSPFSALSATVPLSSSSEIHLANPRTGATCPVLLPTALATLESETCARYGITPGAITETAARAIAEIAMSMLDNSSRRPSRTNTLRGSVASTHAASAGLSPDSVPSVVVIIAGSRTTGARALAAARHLLVRNCRIIIAEVQQQQQEYHSREAQGEQVSEYKQQQAILKRLIKGGASIKRSSWRKASVHIKALPAPPALIIDAFLAGETYDTLDPDAPDSVREIIDWANRSRAPVLSIQCPSGVSGIDGTAPVIEGEPLAIRPERVLGLGAPVKGLLDAVKNGDKFEIWLADIGVEIALAKGEGVGFGREWVIELAIAGGDALLSR